jgi:hypothetical protein
MRSSDTPWWRGEDEILLPNVPDHLPRRADGERVSVATVYRWATAGACGVRLRRFRVGPRGYATTAQELERFQVAQTVAAGEEVA